jgi:hypothetical protein
MRSREDQISELRGKLASLICKEHVAPHGIFCSNCGKPFSTPYGTVALSYNERGFRLAAAEREVGVLRDQVATLEGALCHIEEITNDSPHDDDVWPVVIECHQLAADALLALATSVSEETPQECRGCAASAPRVWLSKQDHLARWGYQHRYYDPTRFEWCDAVTPAPEGSVRR